MDEMTLEYEGNTFLWTVGNNSPRDGASYPRIQEFSIISKRKTQNSRAHTHIHTNTHTKNS